MPNFKYYHIIDIAYVNLHRIELFNKIQKYFVKLYVFNELNS